MNKKVLLIEISPDFEMGGTQKYNHQLINIINNNFNNVQIDQVCAFPGLQKNNKSELCNYFYIKPFKISRIPNQYNFLEWGINILKMRKIVYDLNRKNHYDLIIDSTFSTFKKIYKNNNYLWIQHMAPEFYSSEIYKPFKRQIVKIGKWFFGIKNNLLLAKNLILFSELDNTYVKNHRLDSFNSWCINLSTKISNWSKIDFEESLFLRKNIIYFGRIDDSQKNVSLINSINHNINLIDFYGKGNEEIIKELGKNYKGFLNQDKDSNNLIQKYKYMILMSNCEGFPFSLVESLAAGVPIIVKDSFLDARYLVNNNNNGFMLKNNQSIDEYAKQINEIYNLDNDTYRQLCINSYNFACKNLSEKTFNEKWIAIFNEYLK